MSWRTPSLLLGSYLLGSFPTAYLIGRWLRGIDVRRHGTGNVGAVNAWESVARWTIVPVGLFDMGKAALPAWLALRALDLGYPVAVTAGLCAALGHAWSPFLDFTGGRALGCFLGVLTVVLPWGALVELLMMGMGLVVHVELLTTFGLLALPLLSLALGRPRSVTYGCVAMIVLTVIKRVEANRTPLPSGSERWRIVWRRLWFDRDTPSREEWVSRDPEEIYPSGKKDDARESICDVREDGS